MLRRPYGLYQYYENDNAAQLAGAVIVQVLLHGLILFLMPFPVSLMPIARRSLRPALGPLAVL